MVLFGYIHPFFSYLFILLSVIGIIIVSIFTLFIVMKFRIGIFDKIKFRQLKEAIRANPYIGLKDKDGNFVYKLEGFAVKYKIDSRINRGIAKIKFISAKRRSFSHERRFIKLKKGLRDFWLYQEWLYLFKPKIAFPLLLLILFLYLVIFEPQAHKEYRFRWLVSRITMFDIKDIKLGRQGWVEISGTRETAVDAQEEDIFYKVNPFKWFTFQDDGHITRDRSHHYGTVHYPVKYDSQGNIQLYKDGEWIDSKSFGDKIMWEEAQGSGIRKGEVLGHQLPKEGKLRADDK